MRIPFALQTVFLQSQAGEDVEKIEAPAGGVSSKAYPPIVPKARASDVSHNNNKASATPQKIGYKPVTSRQTAMSLKIFSRLSKKMTTAADATKSKLWHKKKSTDAEGASKEEWVPKIGTEEPTLKEEDETEELVATTANTNNNDIANPQEFLDRELTARGYSAKRYSSLQGGYHCPPNPLQLASFGNHLNQAVRQTNPQLLRELLHVGVSPNACNKFGESIVHSVCRRGESLKLQILLDHQASVQVSDDYGRTPMHDACWQSDDPCFETVRILLSVDRDLMFLTDIRGSTPLTYVKKDNHQAWMEFLQQELDTYWPKLDKDNGSDAVADPSPPPLTLEAPGSQPLPSQISNLGLDVISLVATGQLSATEPRLLLAVRPAGVMPTIADPIKPTAAAEDETDRTIATEDLEDEEDDSSYYSDTDSEYDSDEDYDFDEGDLNEIIMIGNQRQ